MGFPGLHFVKRKLLYFNYTIPALWSQQIVVLLTIISQLQFLSMCKSLAYLLLYFVYFMSMLLRSCCCKFKIALDKHNGDYLHRLFLLLSGEVGIQKNLHKYIILGLCGILRFSLLLFSFQTNPFSSTKQRLFTFHFFC